MGQTMDPDLFRIYQCRRRFKITDDGQSMTIDWLDPWIDENAFHRRDYNLGARVTADGHDGFDIIFRLFRKDQDLPFGLYKYYEKMDTQFKRISINF